MEKKWIYIFNPHISYIWGNTKINNIRKFIFQHRNTVCNITVWKDIG